MFSPIFGLAISSRTYNTKGSKTLAKPVGTCFVLYCFANAENQIT